MITSVATIRMLNYFENWRMVAAEEGIEIEKVRVDLISVLFDVCIMCDIEPKNVLGKEITAVLE